MRFVDFQTASPDPIVSMTWSGGVVRQCGTPGIATEVRLKRETGTSCPDLAIHGPLSSAAAECSHRLVVWNLTLTI